MNKQNPKQLHEEGLVSTGTVDSSRYMFEESPESPDCMKNLFAKTREARKGVVLISSNNKKHINSKKQRVIFPNIAILLLKSMLGTKSNIHVGYVTMVLWKA